MIDRPSSALHRVRAACALLTLVAVALLALLVPPPEAPSAAPLAGGTQASVSVAAAPVRTASTPFLLPPTPTAPSVARLLGEGRASYYGPGLEGNRTANGEIFRMNALTAAHRTLPFGTRVRVTNLRNGETVVVRINDRGPFVGTRIIDLSREAARQIGMIRQGVALVRLELLAEAPEA